MADLFDTAKPVTNQQRVAEALADGMSRDVKTLAEWTDLEAAQARAALNGLHSQNRVEKVGDGYWCLSRRGLSWLEEVRNG